MKTCPSCGSELPDDAVECICGYRYDEDAVLAATGETEDERVSEPELEGDDPAVFGEGPPATKPCVHCFSEIAGPATRCPHCSGYLPITEGTIFGQHFFYLFSALALAIGCILPWERKFVYMNLTGLDSISGGFLFVFATYGIFAAFLNIWHRKMIVWPVILAALDGVIFGWRRVAAIWSQSEILVDAEGKFGQFVQTVRGNISVIGPGLWIVVVFSSLVILSLFVSVFKGARQDAKRKEAERQARSEAAKARKSRR